MRLRRFPLWLVLGLAAVVVLAGGTAGVLYLARRPASGPVAAGPRAGDTAVTVELISPDGTEMTPIRLDRVREVLLSRLSAAGVVRPTVTAAGPDSLRITVAPQDATLARKLLVPGNLSFRKVLQEVSMGIDDQPCAPDGSTVLDEAGASASARRKLGDEYALASQISDPTTAEPGDFPAFATLTCAEVAVLPVQLQQDVPTISCAMLNARPPIAIRDTGDIAVACDGRGVFKYKLDAAKVTGEDVAGATTTPGDPRDNGWWVHLHFSDSGQFKWTALTEDVLGTASPSTHEIAVLFDQTVLSVLSIRSVTEGGDVDVCCGYQPLDGPTATSVAAIVRSGSLRLHFRVLSTDTVR